MVFYLFPFRTFDKLAFFGYNEVEGGDSFETREKIFVPERLRAPDGDCGDEPLPKHLLQTGKPTEDVDTLLLKLVTAKRKRISKKKVS